MAASLLPLTRGRINDWSIFRGGAESVSDKLMMANDDARASSELLLRHLIVIRIIMRKVNKGANGD